jgi:hypothetical protein
MEAMQSLSMQMVDLERTLPANTANFRTLFPFITAYVIAYPVPDGHIGFHQDLNNAARGDAYLLSLTEGRRTTARREDGQLVHRDARIGDVIISPEAPMVDDIRNLTEHSARILPHVNEPAMVLAAFRAKNAEHGFTIAS